MKKEADHRSPSRKTNLIIILILIVIISALILILANFLNFEEDKLTGRTGGFGAPDDNDKGSGEEGSENSGSGGDTSSLGSGGSGGESSSTSKEPREEYCGDGHANQASEECDGNDFRDFSESCVEYGIVYSSGIISCNSDCTIDISDCVDAFCGDGILNSEIGEECDDGNTVNDDLCSNECKEATCGDGIIQTILGENCESSGGDFPEGCNNEFCTYSEDFEEILVADDDNDGIPNEEDGCPLDPLNDADADGICGNQDGCPNTPPGIPVNENGCSEEQTAPPLIIEDAQNIPPILDETLIRPEKVTHKINGGEEFLDIGYTELVIKIGDTFEIIKNGKHHIEISEILDGENVVIRFFSSPKEILFKVGVVQGVDLTDDNNSDILVVVDHIKTMLFSQKEITLTIISSSEKITGTESQEELQNFIAEIKKNPGNKISYSTENDFPIIIILEIIAAITVIFFLTHFFNKLSKRRKLTKTKLNSR